MGRPRHILDHCDVRRKDEVAMPSPDSSEDSPRARTKGADSTDQTLAESWQDRAARPQADGGQAQEDRGEEASPTDDRVTSRSVFALVDPGKTYAEGAMGKILLARDERLGRSLVVKILHEKCRDDPELRARFLREATITAQLQHPGIPPVFNVGTLPDGRPFFTMRLIEGETLARKLAGSADLNADRPRLLTLFEQVCQTVAFAHARGVIHRDLKPEHIVIGEYGSVYVMDWGIARLLGQATCGAGGAVHPPVTLHAEETVAWTGRTIDGAAVEGSSTSTFPGDLLGTPRYMSPEQARGEADQDERTDVFSLGAILFEILTGEPLRPASSVERGSLAGFAEADLAAVPLRLDSARADPPIVELVKRCLQRDRSLRPRDASEVAALVSAYLLHVLERPERDMARFFDLSLDLFCLAGLDGYFKQINRNFTRVLGYTTEELLSRPFVDYVHPDDRAQTQLRVVELAQGLPVVRFENRYRDRGGSFRWFEWMAKSLPDEGLIFAVARDITERRRLEDRLQGIIESFPAAMAMVDSDGVIVLVNNETERLFGYRRSELVGRPLESLIPGKVLRPSVAANRDGAGRGSGAAERCELIGVRQDGARFPVELDYKTFETDEGIFMVAAMADLSSRCATKDEPAGR
jgi:PAS domain S-box-containing protein